MHEEAALLTLLAELRVRVAVAEQQRDQAIERVQQLEAENAAKTPPPPAA